MVGLIPWGDETAYRAEDQRLSDWCADNNLDLNITKDERAGSRRQKEEVQAAAHQHQWGVCGKAVQVLAPGCAHRHRAPTELKHLRGFEEGPTCRCTTPFFIIRNITISDFLEIIRYNFEAMSLTLYIAVVWSY